MKEVTGLFVKMACVCQALQNSLPLHFITLSIFQLSILVYPLHLVNHTKALQMFAGRKLPFIMRFTGYFRNVWASELFVRSRLDLPTNLSYPLH